jgi:transposase
MIVGRVDRRGYPLKASPFNIVIAGRAARTSTHDRHSRIRCLETVLLCDRIEIGRGNVSTHVESPALKGLKTVNELASAYGVHPTQIAHWKHRLQKEMPEIFSARRAKHEHDQETFQAQLYQQIGQLKVELDWVKKKAGLAP